MITRGLRPRGAYAVRQQRATTPQPRQRLRRLQHLQEDEAEVKEEEMNDLDNFNNEVNEYYAEEAARRYNNIARQEDIVENEENDDDYDEENDDDYDKLVKKRN
eukprot:4696749-Amphidinium_carterae.1